MKIVCTAEILRANEAIAACIAQGNRSAAPALADLIFTYVEDVLPENRETGRLGRVEGTRTLVIQASYTVAYGQTTVSLGTLTVRTALRLWSDALSG